MRIHFISNSLYINSGFGKVTRYIALGLKELNHEVNMTGLQTSQKADYHYGIQCLPIDTEHVDETTQLILNVQKTNPDIVFYMGQLDADLNHLAKVFPKTVSYSPVEGNNIPLQMANDMLQIEKNGGLLVAQCRYGQQEMKKVGVSAEMIYHGYDPDIFYPTKNFKPYCYYATSQGQINTDPVILCKQGCFNCKEKDLNKNNCNCQYWEEEIVSILKWDKDNKKWSQNDIPISKLKEQFNNKYIYQFTGQNFGLRKQIPRLLKAYSILINESRQIKDNTILAMHTLPISIRGVDLIKIITELGISENVIFTYGTFGSSGWSENAMCLVPESPILTLSRDIKKIKDIKVGDKVLTHKGRFMRVSNVMNRQYIGDMIKIVPFGLRIPLILTPEHRILAVKTVLCENRSLNSRICRPGLQCNHRNNVGNTKKLCRYPDGYEPYMKYRQQWIRARDLEIGDFVTYPKSDNKEVDIEEIKILDYIDDIDELGIRDYSGQMDLFGEPIEELTTRNPNPDINIRIPPKFKLTEDMMRIFGYFIAEGHIYENEIGFSFNVDEREYIEDVERVMNDTFGLVCGHNIKNNTDKLRYQNKILAQMFKNMFVPDHDIRKGPGRKAHVVRIPQEFLSLPKNKLSELIKGYWRGDGSGSSTDSYDTIVISSYSMGTTSENLAHQLVYILSKFDILPSIYKDKENITKHRHENFQILIIGKDILPFNEIIGEDHHNLKKDELIRASQYLKGKNYFFIPIKDIDTINYNGYVWNLEVEEDNSYVSTVVIHNCIWYNIADINISASSSEGFGLPTLESMACGKPNIGPNCSSFTELIGEDKDQNKNRGLLAKIATQHMIQDGSYRSLTDEKDLAEKMKIMYVKKEDRETYSKNAIKFAQQFTWNKVIKQWNDLLQEML